MKSPFKNYTIAVTGDFGEPRNHKALERWIESNGGRFAATVDANVTHLICTWDDWEKKVPKVRHALRLRNVQVVTYDWLEDSLMTKRPRHEKAYLLSTLEKAKRRKAKEKKMAAKAAFDKECASAEDETLSSSYHIYRDETLFEYSIILARADLRTNRNERHQVKIYESHGIPRLYTVATKYTRPGRSAKQMLCPLASFFDDAFACFRNFFKQKTGMAWEDRLSKKVRDRLKDDDSLFRYLPPPLGRPRGRMPSGWVDEEEEAEKEGGMGVVAMAREGKGQA